MNAGKTESHVVDTNVLVVANGKHQHANDDEVFKCQRFLFGLEEKHISIDSLNLIFNEYFSHASRSGQPGAGDAFVKWLWNNQYNISICERVEITPDDRDERGFCEFPRDEDLKGFDADDRKFVAVAVSSNYDAVICNATDSDWWDYKDVFKRLGIRLNFLCPRLIKKIG